MSFTVYIIAFFSILITAFIIFRIRVRDDYRENGRLTPFSTLLEGLIFCIWGLFTWADLPSDWPPADLNVAFKIAGGGLIILGLVGMFLVIARFGVLRACGLEVSVLVESGPYRLTRNPQILFCGLAVVGYALLWPSWHTLGWVLLYAAIAHLMVLTEEEHLRNVHGAEYVRYVSRIPRYFGFIREDQGRIS